MNARLSARLRAAVGTNVDAPMVWMSAVAALLGIVVGALAAALIGFPDVALPAGFVAANLHMAAARPDLAPYVGIEIEAPSLARRAVA